MANGGQSEQALGFFNRALELDSLDVAVHNDLACVYADQKKYNAALSHLHRAINIAPGVAILHYNLGSLRQYMGEFLTSEAAYKRALSLAPGGACVESKWAPKITTSCARSVPGISPIILNAFRNSFSS